MTNCYRKIWFVNSLSLQEKKLYKNKMRTATFTVQRNSTTTDPRMFDCGGPNVLFVVAVPSHQQQAIHKFTTSYWNCTIAIEIEP
jgi:hypothetical protein